ncbi:MAG: hypothetical protein WD768_09520 [Phycisphaeraceae bacterium]
MTESPHIIKLGGSLLDLPDLVARFESFRTAQVTGPALLVTGGAESAEVVRYFDKHFHLDEEQGHWLAVRAMQLNAHLVAAVLPASRIVCDEGEANAAWAAGAMAVMDPLEWLRREEARGVCVPHRWSFTSDSIAAHVATQLRAQRLTLVKSRLPAGGPNPGPLPKGEGVEHAAAEGFVDRDFPQASAMIPSIDLINLRHSPSPAEPAARRILK